MLFCSSRMRKLAVPLRKKPIAYFIAAVLSTHGITAFGEASLLSGNTPKLQQQKLHYDLPRLPLSQAIVEFSIQADVSIVAQSKQFKQLYSSPLKGAYSVEQALVKLLENTQLLFTYEPKSQRLVIFPKAIVTDIKPIAKASVFDPSENALALEEVLVMGRQYPYRYNTVTSSQVHNGLSVYDTSRFLSVLPEQLIDDQVPSDLLDLLRNSSGITPADGLADSNDDYYIRGFPRNAIYWSGMRLDNQLGTKILPAMLERVEVLKGPSTLRYGQAAPGGIVNLIGKQAKTEAAGFMKLGAGSEGFQTVQADITGSLDKQQKLSARLVYATEEFDQLKDHTDVEKTAYLPSVKYSPNENTHFEMSYLSQESNHQRDQGLIVFSPKGDSVNVVAEDAQARQARPDFNAQCNLFSASFTQYFLDHWQLQAKFSQLDEERDGVRGDDDIFVRERPLVDPGERPELIRSIYDESSRFTSNFGSVTLQGSPTFWGVTQRWLVGVDIYQTSLWESITLEHRDNTQVAASTTLGELKTNGQTLAYNDYGVYAQDNIEFGHKWVASIGARFMQTDAELMGDNDAQPIALTTFKETSAQLGLVYKASDNYSIYSSYSQSVKPNYVMDDVGSDIDEPELSDQLELGVKLFPNNPTLTGTSALYVINKRNIVNVALWDGVRRASIHEQQRVQGWDTDFTYQINNNLDAIAAFSYIDAEIVEGAVTDDGDSTGNIPQHVADYTASVWVNYRPGWLGFDGSPLALTMGYYRIGSRYTNSENTGVLPAVGIMDAGLRYDVDFGLTRAEFSVQVKNLLDKEYYASSSGDLRSNLGLGRTFMASMAIRF